MAKLKIKNGAHQLAFIKYKGIKEGGRTFVDLKASVAPTKTYETVMEVPPGSEVSVKIGNVEKKAKANTNKVLTIKGGTSPANWTLA